jgi:SH3-like domain-containing protein
MSLAYSIKEAYDDQRRYRDKDGNENWAEWDGQNEDRARMLADARRFANEMGLLKE